MLLGGEMYGHNDREIFYHIYGAEHFTDRFPWTPKPKLTISINDQGLGVPV